MSFASRGPVSATSFRSNQYSTDIDICPDHSEETNSGRETALLYGTMALALVACAALIAGSFIVAFGAAFACAAGVTIGIDWVGTESILPPAPRRSPADLGQSTSE